MGNKKLVDFAVMEGERVWSRYGCMVVANSILLGFIGQLVTKEYEGECLGIFACVMGLVIAFLWLFITSYGWSLSWHILKKSQGNELEAYQEWKKKASHIRGKDPIWLCAHLLIFIFCSAYVLLILHFSKYRFWPVVCTIVPIIIVLAYWFKKFVFDEPKAEQKQ